MDNNAPIFPEGITWKDPAEKAPLWIKGQIHVNARKLTEWLQANPGLISERGYIVFDIKESKKGGLYFSVNTWKPLRQEASEEAYIPTATEMKSNSPHGENYPVEGEVGVPNPNNIPF